MPKSKKIRVNLRHSDQWRSLLTDTSPFEVPIIYSTDGFYKNLHGLLAKSSETQAFIGALVLKRRDFTIPLRYRIVKDSVSFRQLSLLHPNAQIKIAEFYTKYDQLICESSANGPYSIRYPQKIGSSFYTDSPIADKNKYRDQSIDTVGIENLVRNPATYFSYYGFDRLYKFFRSTDHDKLEKKFRRMLTLDVSKCFDSIYTHSISWAVKSTKLAKNQIGASTFGNNFDKLMQAANYNETSGICIGPETSRIFAEIILTEVDKEIEQRLNALGIINKVDYEGRRYVDNYYFFGNSESCLRRIEQEVSTCLAEFKMHLNSGKTELVSRPFYTAKSYAVDNVNKSILALKDSVSKTGYLDGKRFNFAARVFRHERKLGSFVREIKAACHADGLGYDAVANVLVSAMKNFALELIEGFQKAIDIDEDERPVEIEVGYYRQVLMLLLEVSYYFFSLHPTASSSYKLSHSMVAISEFFKEHDRDGFEMAKEYVLRWTSMLVTAPTFSEIFIRSNLVPIEFLNVVLALREFSDHGELEAELLSKSKFEEGDNRYFQSVVKLFIYADFVEFASERQSTFADAVRSIETVSSLTRSSEHTHLLLDLLACPYVGKKERVELLLIARKKLNQEGASLSAITKAKAEAMVSEFEEQHWFVWWKGIDLLNMIEKKELSAVYS